MGHSPIASHHATVIAHKIGAGYRCSTCILEFTLMNRLFAAILCLPLLLGCAKQDLSGPPVPLGQFVMGHNIVVTTNMQKVPISREATGAEWEAALEQAMADRFGRYDGDRIYNFGIAIDAYALAPPGIPVVAAPKSVLAITANIWDDRIQTKLNEEGKQMIVFEGFSGESVIGTGLTRTKEEQMAALAFNAALAVERWLLEHPEWFDIDPELAAAALATTTAPPTAALPGAEPADESTAIATENETVAAELPPDLLSPPAN
jgi:hypothetical protein